MSATKHQYLNLIREQYELPSTAVTFCRSLVPAPTPRATPAPRLSEVHILTHFGEVVGAYANNATAKADMAIMQHGAYLNGDTRDGDAYEVLSLTVFSQ
jgi:hypothetical protein